MFTNVKHLFRRQAAVGAALSVLLSCFPLAPAAAAPVSGTCGDDLTWTLDGNGVLTVSGTGAMADYNNSAKPWGGGITQVVLHSGVTYIGKDAFSFCGGLTNITIPESVTDIGERAFLGCDSLTECAVAAGNPRYYDVDGVLFDGDNAALVQYPPAKTASSYAVPQGIVTIGENAFNDCDYLTDLTFPESLTTIGRRAFFLCDGLTTVTLPATVAHIGDAAFGECTSLTAFSVAAGNPRYYEVDGVLFDGDNSALVCYPLGKKDQTYTVPAGITAIGNYAFYESWRLTGVTLPAGLTHIGDLAFYDCIVLTDVELPGTVTSLGDKAFEDCLALTDMSLPAGLTHIGSEAFSGCSGLTGLTIPESVTDIGELAFQSCSSLTAITVAAGNPHFYDVDGVLFHGDSGSLVLYPLGKTASSYAVPQGVTAIDDYAFDSCDSLTTVTLPAGLTRIGEGAFWWCNELTDVNIPSGVTSIGEKAFWHCDSLTNVAIPESVNSIGETAFACCESLTAISVAAGNPRYYDLDGVLFDRDSSALLQYPIGKTDPFYVVPGGVTAIADCSFADCGNLTGVIIPATVTSIGSETFVDCDQLAHIYYGGSKAQWDGVVGKYFELDESTVLHFAGDSVYALPNAVLYGSYTAAYPEKAAGSVYSVMDDTLPAWMVAVSQADGTLAFSGVPSSPGSYELEVYTVGTDIGLWRLRVTVEDNAEGGSSGSSDDWTPSPSKTEVQPTQPQQADQSGSFEDVPLSAWYSDAVKFVCEKGLMNGVGNGTFAPDMTTSRGMIAAILYRAEGSPAVGGQSFQDVAPGSYYAQGAVWAAEKDIMKGTGGGAFQGDAPLTREDLMVVLYRYLNFKGVKTQAAAHLTGFADGDRVSGYAAEAVAWAVSQGILQGNENKALNPGGTCTRAELAALLQRTLTYLDTHK